MSASLRAVSNGILKSLEGVKEREKALQGYLNRNVVEQYRNAQRTRWMTENASEGQKWTRLNADYAKRKKKVYATYPGAGSKMLIATNRLFKSVIGPGEGFRKVTTPRSLTISTTVEYAPFVSEARDFTHFGKKTMSEIKRGVMRFVAKGILKDVSEIV